MPLSISLHTNLFVNDHIYLEETETLANRIDFAWIIYNSTQNQMIKAKALEFLGFAFDISPHTTDTPQIIKYLIAKREKYKTTNPDYIPGKVPHHVNLHPGKLLMHKTLKRGNTPIVDLKLAIEYEELLDVRSSEKKIDLARQILEFNSEQRKHYRVHIHNGQFTQNGKSFDTRGMVSHRKNNFAAFTFNLEGELSLFNHLGGRDDILHSTMNSGLPVVYESRLTQLLGVFKQKIRHKSFTTVEFENYSVLQKMKTVA